jgi:hypothetical protein
MAHRKTAIAVPEDLLEAVDDAARERGESRSAYISRILRLAVRARRSAEITRRLDALFADPSLAASQVRDAEAWEDVAAPWEDERW